MKGGLVPGLPSTKADTTREVQEREQAKFREREWAQAPRDRRDEEVMLQEDQMVASQRAREQKRYQYQQDEQRRVAREAQDEARKVQNAENYRLREEQKLAAGDMVAVQAWFGSYVFTNKSRKTVSGPTFRLLKLWRLQAGVSGSSSLRSSPVTKRRRIL